MLLSIRYSVDAHFMYMDEFERMNSDIVLQCIVYLSALRSQFSFVHAANASGLVVSEHINRVIRLAFVL